MKLRQQSAIWLCTLLLLVQSLLPASAAVALVSVRCAASANPQSCARALLPVEGGLAAGAPAAPMACCRHMGIEGCGKVPQGRSPRVQGLQVHPALPCLCTLSLLSLDRPVLVPPTRTLLIPASIAPAPAVAQFDLRALSPIGRIQAASCALPPRSSAQAHGLRAPPAA